MNLNNKKGFTLIEIIAALGIAAAGLLVINAGRTTLRRSAQKIEYTTSLTDLRARL
jgi:prepilin-type N-terminal cleavage/methylation domain-containing protein